MENAVPKPRLGAWRRGTLAGLVAVALLAIAASTSLGPRFRAWRLRAAPRPLDVVLITLDTTRADHLGCYGARSGASPQIDRLASEGTLFRAAYAHVPLTAPSHASFLTGLLPPRHGIHDNGGFVLGAGFPTLAELLAESGYRTAAFVSAFVLDRRFGLARGFGSYEDDMRGPSTSTARERRAQSVPASVSVDRALAWLRREDPRPAFAWVHLYDPHAPYEPPEPFRTRFRESPYDGEIAYMDAEAGRLLAELAERRRRGRPALVAVLGDHGESLGEHGETTHNYFVYSATQHVPFLLALPGHVPAGREVRPVVRGVDLMPTLLEILGLGAPPGLDGRSVVPLLTGASRSEPGPAYLESFHPRLWWGARELVGLRTEQWLYVRAPRPELYDVRRDPGELRNVVARHPAEREALDARLTALAGAGDPLAGRTGVDASTAANLRALGYLGAGVELSTPEDASLPDAKDNGPLLAGSMRGRELAEEGRHEEALAVFRDTLRLNPRSTHLRLKVAETLYALQRLDEAFAAFEELDAGPPGNEHYPLAMALCRLGQGRPAEALDIVRAGLVRFPASPRLLERAGAILLDLGRPREAEEELRRAIAVAPGQLSSRLLLATALEGQGRPAEAAAALREVVERDRASSEAQEAGPRLADLGTALVRSAAFEDARRSYRAAIDAGVRDEAVYLNLSLACHRLKRLPESVETLVEGTEAFPRSATLHYRLGWLLAEGGRRTEAADHYRRALELDAGHGPARSALARLERSGS